VASGSEAARRSLVVLVALAGSFAVASGAAGQEAAPTVAEISGRAAAPSGLLGALETEARLYVDDAWALVRAPFQWGGEDRTRAAGAIVLVGGLMAFDSKLAFESQERRSGFTNRVSRLTTGLGSADAWFFSGGLVASGLAFHDPHLSVMGREAIEASVFAGLITSMLKPTLGRVRPRDGNNETAYEPLSSPNSSFPSGHATEAFAVASVVAARSNGWLVPTLAYTAATVVAFDRVNDRAHFPSDVAAGAVIGTVVGRFLVHRHERTETPSVDISLAPIPHGLGLVAHF
jgi:membrane-associated phospholipid phosphatase